MVFGCTTQQVVSSGGVLKTGQTTAFTADKNDGILGAVAVNDDGTLQLGAALDYQDNLDGTVTDLNTGLMWEQKLASADASCTSGTDLRCVNKVYLWSGNGSQETIWDWLDDLNASNFAGHSDWRIPNLRELQSIVNYGLFNPSIDPTFGPTQSSYYWSSTTLANGTSNAWGVYFGNGSVDPVGKSGCFCGVRAVRGGS